MQVGELYTLRKRCTHNTFKDWKGKPALYLGVSIINRTDTVIVNHVFLLGGERRITDPSFLQSLEPLTSS